MNWFSVGLVCLQLLKFTNSDRWLNMNVTERREESPLNETSLSNKPVNDFHIVHNGSSTRSEDDEAEDEDDVITATETDDPKCKYKVLLKSLHTKKIDRYNFWCVCWGVCGKNLKKILKTIEKRRLQSAQETEEMGLLEYEKADTLSQLIVLSLLFVLGTVGNVLTIYGIKRWIKNRNPTMLFIISLAALDIILLFIGVPLKIAELLFVDRHFDTMSCKMLNFVRDFACTCCIITMTAISIERYYAICYPFEARLQCTRRRAIISALTLWPITAVIASPSLVSHKFIRSELNHKHTCMTVFPNVWLQKLYGIHWLCLVFLFPLCVMTFTYGNMCLALWKSYKEGTLTEEGKNGKVFQMIRKTRGSTTVDTVSIQDRRKVIRMLILMLVIFTICWAPKQIYLLLESFDLISQIGRTRILGRLESLIYFHACLEPYIIIILSKQLRRGFTTSRMYQLLVRILKCDTERQNEIASSCSLEPY